MRYLKFALAGACAFGFVGLNTANSAEPVKIRMAWVAPVANWASIVLEKKDLATHMGKSYTLESVRYLIEEAQLFIEAAHSCNQRLTEQRAKARASLAVPEAALETAEAT